MSGELLLLAALVGLVVFVALTVILLLLLKRQYGQHAGRVRYAAGPPRWSTVQLHELARRRSKPRRLGRSHPVIRPWETHMHGARDR